MSIETVIEELTAAVTDLKNAVVGIAAAQKLAAVMPAQDAQGEPPQAAEQRRKARTEAAQSKLLEAEPAAEAEQPDEPEKETAGPVTKDVLIAELLEVGRVCGRSKLQGILADHGAPNASALKATQYPSVLKAAKQALRLAAE